MNRLFCSCAVFCLLLSAAFLPDSVLAKSSGGASQQPFGSPPIVGKRKDARTEILSGRGLTANEFEFHEPGASFIKVHFANFHLPAGVTVEVSSPDGSESYRYSKENKGPKTFDPSQGEDGFRSFSAMSISGDTAVVRVYGKTKRIDQRKHRLIIDYLMQGTEHDS